MASSSFTFKPLQQTQLQLLSFTHCKYSSTLNPFKFHSSLHTISTCSSNKDNIIIYHYQPRFSCLEINAHATTTTSTSDTDHLLSRTNNNTKHKTNNVNGSVFKKHNLEHGLNGVAEKSIAKRVILKDRYAKNRSKNGSVKSRDENFARDNGKSKEFKVRSKKGEREFKNGDGGEVEVEKMEKGSKKTKVEGPGTTLRLGLDMCSKRGDVMAAIWLYDLARQEGVKMGQYHYAVLLYLCSSAATGVVQPAKSGSGGRCLNPVDLSKEISVDGSENLSESREMGRNSGRNESSMQVMDNELQRRTLNRENLIVDGYMDEVTEEAKDGSLSVEEKLTTSSNGSVVLYPETLDGLVQLMKKNADNSKTKDLGGLQGGYGIQVSEDVKKFALRKGFEIYEKMCLENVPMNEATLTSVARMAMSLGDGDKAFDMVKQMKELGINPRLRSYGPALSVFCSNGDVEKAFLVEEHMLEHCVYPEEPELEALLRVSVEAGRSEKVYYLLHKLRTSVRQVSPSTADVIEKWFKSKVASRVGKRKWDKKLIAEAIENGGGGWHGQGWMGKGKWSISRTFVGSDGLCSCCGEKLVTIDLDPVETENFAKSVASIAVQREKNSSFQKFQKWLDYYGPFEAVVDGANVGLYSQRRFKPSKVNAVVNGIRQMLPSKKWPLIILHNRRITGDKMDGAVNKKLIEKWKNADALYATPTGSNDDWYWLYAAIKFKCLLVTNDEMRDHLFQLLGTDFFPKWKERHQVHFSFTETGPVFRMPPPCSVVIQESEKGHWHIPIISESERDEERTWLCIRRDQSLVEPQVSPSIHGESGIGQGKKEHSKSGSQIKSQVKLTPTKQGDQIDSKRQPQEIYRNLKSILSPSTFVNHPTILPELEAAEKLSGCVIDFQI